MPDPVAYLLALAAAAGAAALPVMALACVRRSAGCVPRPAAEVARSNAACALGVGVGWVAGCLVLGFRPAWPPSSALDRLVWLVLPATTAIELLAGWRRMPGWAVWVARIALAAASGRVLLDGSVYLSDRQGAWTAWQAGLVLALCGGSLALVWAVLGWLARRPASFSIPLVLAQASLGGGIAIALAGYLGGGEASLLLAAALVVVSGASRTMTTRPSLEGAVGLGAVLFLGLVFIGRFFGGLSTSEALLLGFAPLLCAVSEVPGLRRAKSWQIAAVRLALVAIPLVVVLIGV